MPRITIRVSFTDNNGKRAQVQVYPGATSFTGAAAYAAALVSALAGVSSAAIEGYSLSFKAELPSPPPAGPESDTRTSMLLFYRSGDSVQSVRVPSPGPLPTESAGAYAGIRLTRELATVSGVLIPVEAIPPLLADSMGGPYPTAFSVGGRIEL